MLHNDVNRSWAKRCRQAGRMASPDAYAQGLHKDRELLTNWSAKATEMCSLVSGCWRQSLLTKLLTLCATNWISFLGAIRKLCVLFLPWILFGGIISADYFLLCNSSMLFLRKGIPMADTLLDGACSEEGWRCLPAEPLDQTVTLVHPLSVTVSKHRLAHHSGLGLQLLHLLQQSLFAGVLGRSPRHVFNQTRSRNQEQSQPEVRRAQDHSCLPFHVRSNGDGRPDGWIDTEEHQPDQHASPHRQVTEFRPSCRLQTSFQTNCNHNVRVNNISNKQIVCGMTAGYWSIWKTKKPLSASRRLQCKFCFCFHIFCFIFMFRV